MSSTNTFLRDKSHGTMCCIFVCAGWSLFLDFCGWRKKIVRWRVVTGYHLCVGSITGGVIRDLISYRILGKYVIVFEKSCKGRQMLEDNNKKRSAVWIFMNNYTNKNYLWCPKLVLTVFQYYSIFKHHYILIHHQLFNKFSFQFLWSLHRKEARTMKSRILLGCRIVMLLTELGCRNSCSVSLKLKINHRHWSWKKQSRMGAYF